MNHFDLSRRRALHSAVAIATAPFAFGIATAQTAQFPTKPIRIVVEFAAGIPADVYMRAVGEQLAKQLGTPVIIDNQPGAAGALAVQTVSRAPPDGHTLLGATTSALILRPLLNLSSVNAARDVTPITALWDAPSVVAVAANSPFRSMKELIEYARAHPDELAFGTTGVGGMHHFNGLQLQQFTGTRLRHVPYKNANEYMLQLIAGELPMLFANGAVAVPFLKSGRIRILAVVEERSSLFPGVPAVAEAVPGFAGVKNWTGLFGPAKLPAAILDRINAEVIKALATPSVRQAILDSGFTPLGESPAAFQARIQTQLASVSKLAKAVNIKAEN